MRASLKTVQFVLCALVLGLPCYSANGYQEPPHSADMFGGPTAGETAPSFWLKTIDGGTVELKELLKKGPVVLETASYTCPVFRGQHAAVEQLREKYGQRVSFVTLYTVEAHPKGDVSPYTGREWVTDDNEKSGVLFRQPTSDSQRLDVARRARTALNVRTTLMLDDMSNSVWKAYGSAPNAGYLIGKDGRILLRQGWINPQELEKTLKNLK